ncbi:MAG: transposase [Clostridia bacterium]|nr:transposase [Clostridia bacterium]
MAEYIEFDKEHRLRNYNYSTANSYMLTFNTKNREKCLSQIIDRGEIELPEVRLSVYGKIVEHYISQIPSVYDDVKIDTYVIMPDHVHILLSLLKTEESDSIENSKVSRIIRALKSLTSKQIGRSLWQADFYDVIADTDKKFDRCYDYIKANPAVWLRKREEPVFGLNEANGASVSP